MTGSVATSHRSIASHARLLVVAAWMVVSLLAITAGYRGTSPVLAWQMFPEASTWQASIVRVVADGSEIDVRQPWPGGYRWELLVAARGLGAPFRESDAAYGVAATLDGLQQALDWVAKNTPRDGETQRLVATVTYRHNDDDPQVAVVRSVQRDVVP